MGCISSNQIKKPKAKKPMNSANSDAPLYRSKLDKSYASKKPQQESKPEPLPQIQVVPKIKPITSQQFLNTYQVVRTLETASRLEGPKLVCNRVDGTTKVLRVYNQEQVCEKRLLGFQEQLGFEIFRDEEQNLLVLDRYCSGPFVCEILQPQSFMDLNLSTDTKRQQMLAYGVLLKIYDIILSFHRAGLYLGNLNLFSFRKSSVFEEQVSLVDYCFEQEGDKSRRSVGFAHRDSTKADWEFFGYLMQYYLSNKTPIFILHKMQYVEFESVPYSQLIVPLLKGKEIPRKQLAGISPEDLLVKNEAVLYGYKFRNDIGKLLEMRKRRKKHKSVYYGQELLAISQQRKTVEQNYFQLKGVYRKAGPFHEQQMHQIQTENILRQIENYIEKVGPDCEEHFLNYSSGGEGLSRLKEVFLIKDRRGKFEEFKELLPNIK